MNHPLDHTGYTFYQMRYQPDIDPQTERPTGRFQSVFQVATNPGRPIIYGGCLLVVLGTFVQFYMRAGVFTDGGKRERRAGRNRHGHGPTTARSRAEAAEPRRSRAMSRTPAEWYRRDLARPTEESWKSGTSADEAVNQIPDGGWQIAGDCSA